jgi:hypothetical protein
MSRYRVEVDAVITTVLYVDAGGTFGAVDQAEKFMNELELPENFQLWNMQFKRWGWQANEAEEILEDQEVPD